MTNRYIRSIDRLRKQVEETGTAVPLTPYLQREKDPHLERTKAPEFCDTSLSAGSFNAALRACGAAIHAVDQVIFICCRKHSRKGLCSARPLPRHDTHHTTRHHIYAWTVRPKHCVDACGSALCMATVLRVERMRLFASDVWRCPVVCFVLTW